MTQPDWKNPKDYSFTDSLDESGWAWEFLRRNQEYQSYWKTCRDQVAVYENELGSDWSQDLSTWRCIPELMGGETVTQWRSRCREAELDFEHLQFTQFCARYWGLVSQMPDPSISYYEQDSPVRFMKPHGYPRVITDEIEFKAHTADDESIPYRETADEYCVVAFDLTRSIDRQVAVAEERLLLEAKKLGKKDIDRRNPDAWPTYLRALDANRQNASYVEIGLQLTTASNDDYPERPASNNANHLLRRARRMTTNYRSILIPLPAKNQEK